MREPQTEQLFVVARLLAVFISLFLTISAASAAELTAMEELGKQLFFDKNLSQPRIQSCASCHDPRMGFTSPNFFANLLGAVVPGAKFPRAGNRKPPTATYATFSRIFDRTRVRGGNFWDGRATGEVITEAIFPSDWSIEKIEEMKAHLGPAADQAMGPFLNDVEMNLPSAEALCKRVESASYVGLYEHAWGEPVKCNGGPVLAEETHKRIAFAIAVYEGSKEVNSFSSKRDFALANDADGAFPLDDFTDQENLGHELFYSRQNGCARFCHSNSFRGDGTDPKELYTADGYFNIGVPRNPDNPWYRMNKVRDDNGNIINPLGRKWVDLGVGARDDDGDSIPDFPDRKGEFKTPTMRNLDKRFSNFFPKAYSHNGYFKSIKGIVHFYNTRDMRPTCTDKRGNPQLFVRESRALARGCWPQAEVPQNIFQCGGSGPDREDCKVGPAATFATYCDNPDNVRDIGNLCLSDEEEDAIVAYLKTLSDTAKILPPQPNVHTRRRSGDFRKR
jgi:cytochrome c peroxidase